MTTDALSDVQEAFNESLGEDITIDTDGDTATAHVEYSDRTNILLGSLAGLEQAKSIVRERFEWNIETDDHDKAQECVAIMSELDGDAADELASELNEEIQ